MFLFTKHHIPLHATCHSNGAIVPTYPSLHTPTNHTSLTQNSPAFESLSNSITYIPIHLGQLMQQAGNTAPVLIKNKKEWIGLERERWAKQFSIPMSDSMPVPFPQSTVNTQRALCYIASHHPASLVPAIDALYRAFWIESKTIGKVEVIEAVLEPVVGREKVKAVVEGVKSEGVKKMLAENTKKAFGDGAFGLPWFVATNAQGKTEGFWGVDHIGQLLEHMGVEVQREGGYRAML